MRLLFRISVLFVLGQLLYKTVSQRCGSEISIFGWILQGHIYSTMLADLPHTCVQVCREDDRCQSFNWVISLLKCEFSNRTKEARPEDFISDPDRFYYKRDRNRVPLDSIPELPAEICLEIKMSEGHAISRKYWFSSIKTGTSVLAYCDMKTEDIDECTSSVPLCDVNATCTNNDGSYICICKNGFSGDGKTCKAHCGILFDFENGLSGWTLTGNAFNNQPTYGDNSLERGKGLANHKGNWWIGGLENRPSPSHQAGAILSDVPQGTMTSPCFGINGNSLRFLIGGSCFIDEIRAELIVDGNVVFRETGDCHESMTEKSWDVSGFVGRIAQLRLVDHSSGHWGHINFDHLICQ